VGLYPIIRAGRGTILEVVKVSSDFLKKKGYRKGDHSRIEESTLRVGVLRSREKLRSQYRTCQVGANYNRTMAFFGAVGAIVNNRSGIGGGFEDSLFSREILWPPGLAWGNSFITSRYLLEPSREGQNDFVKSDRKEWEGVPWKQIICQ